MPHEPPLAWLLRKTAGAAAIVAVVLAIAGAWTYVKEAVDFEGRREAVMETLSGERHRLAEARGKVQARRDAEAAERAREEARLRTARSGLKALDELNGGVLTRWLPVVGASQADRERRAKLEGFRKAAEARIRELDETLKLEDYTLEGLDLAVGKVDRRIETLHSSAPAWVRYLREVWQRAEAYVLAAVAAWFLGPFLGKLSLYFLVAPWISRARPIRFSEAKSSAVQGSASKPALEVELARGEVLRVKEVHLQASDEGLRKRTRWLFDWRMPFTSFACRLVEMIELKHPGEGGRCRATIASSTDGSLEFALVTIPAGESLIVRPRFIVGMAFAEEARPRIRRHWVLGRWQAWMTRQFRFFEFEGPCRLILSGGRGVRVENLRPSEDGGPSWSQARRANRQAIIGFTPGLEYRPVRAETFWAYYRGMNPLFDELFVGNGLFLCQANAGAERAESKFWHLVWSGVRRLAGM